MIELSLEAARQELRAKLSQGTICPCCEQYAKIYKRPLNAAMALVLLLLYRRAMALSDFGWVHVENYLKNLTSVPAALRGDFHKLTHWGLLEAKKEEQEDGNPRNGFYRLTPNGIKFSRREIMVPSHVYLYNDSALGFESKMVAVDATLGKRWRYDEVVSAPAWGATP
jgi:hypothetical protein